MKRAVACILMTMVILLSLLVPAGADHAVPFPTKVIPLWNADENWDSPGDFTVDRETQVEGEGCVSIELGKKGIKKTDKIVIASNGVELAYEIEENNSKAYEAKLTLDYGEYGEGKETFFTVEVDKKKDGFKVVAGDYTVKGDVSKKGKVTTIAVDKILVDGEEAITTDLEIIINTSDKIPSAPKDYKTIADIKEEDIESWMKKLEGEE